MIHNNDLHVVWQRRQELYTEAEKLYAEGEKLYDQIDKLRSEIANLQVKANGLRSAASSVFIQADKVWDAAIVRAYGDAASIWWDGRFTCTVAGITYSDK